MQELCRSYIVEMSFPLGMEELDTGWVFEGDDP